MNPLVRIVVLAVTASVLFCVEASRADVIVLKNGFVLTGKVRRDVTQVFDKEAKTMVPVASAKGFFEMDGIYRTTVFSSQQILREPDAVGDDDTSKGLIRLEKKMTRKFKNEIKPLVEFAANPVDDKWVRKIGFRTSSKRDTDEQVVTMLTPNYVLFDNRRYQWTTYYQTRELGLEQVKQLLYSHESLEEKDGKPNKDRRIHIFRFLVQAGWLDAAGQELDRLEKDAPELKEKVVEPYRTALKEARTQRLLDEIDRAHEVGRHGWAQEQIGKLTIDGLEAKQQDKIRKLKTDYETDAEAVKAAREFLQYFSIKCSQANQEFFKEAADSLLAELDLDNHHRLKSFVDFARQADRELKAGRKVTHIADDLMGMALSGWLLGNSAAQPKAEIGIRLWKARQLALAYQKETDASKRKSALTDFEKAGGIDIDEMAQIVAVLPPPEPEKLDEKTAKGVLQLKAPQPGKLGTVDYLVQLPPEYRLGRDYPVLFVLHNVSEKPSAAMQPWLEQAMRNGYIVVAPDWGARIGQGTYNYSPAEHAAVLDVLRDLRRRFAVDSDRIFLSGYYAGGAMAFDVGLSHPDLFAGVVPMCAPPRMYARAYAANGRLLPFYVVGGQMGASPGAEARRMSDETRDHFKTWMQGGFPALFVEYKGRHTEFFAEELPQIFTWFDCNKKRAMPIPDLPDCHSLRTADDRFWWIGLEGLPERNLDEKAFGRPLNPSVVSASCVAASNTVRVTYKGAKGVKIWLGPKMVDFTKPVDLVVNNKTLKKGMKVTPKMSVLMEDFYMRGDRKRLFFDVFSVN